MVECGECEGTVGESERKDLRECAVIKEGWKIIPEGKSGYGGKISKCG